MTQTTQQTTTTYKDLFPKTHEKVKAIVADESFGSRDVEDLGRKVVMEEPLEKEDIQQIKKFAEERAFYLNDSKAEEVREQAREVMK